MKLLICTQAVDKNHPILGFFHRWIEEFAKHFDEVHIICLQKGVFSFPPHVYVYSLGKEGGESKIKYLFRFYKYFARVFFVSKVEYVFYHMGAIYNIIGAPFYFVRTLFGTRFYWWKAHGYISITARLGLLFVDTVLTSTETGFAVKTKKKRIVGQAIDTELFSFGSQSNRKKEVVFVGRIMPVKHLEDFIDTAKILLSENSDLKFTVIGPYRDDDIYYSQLKEKCISENVSDHIKFTGPKTQEELVHIYQNASVFLNTSMTHSMDKTVLESSLCGCVPVIVTTHEAAEGAMAQAAKQISAMDAVCKPPMIVRIMKMPGS